MDTKKANLTFEELTSNLSMTMESTSEVPPDTAIDVDTGPSEPITPDPFANYAAPPRPPPMVPIIPITRTINRGPPPSYEEAIDPNAPPPSYESLFGRVKDAQKSIFDFLQNILILFLGTIGCTIVLSISMIIPISMMIIGGIYLYDCPQGEYIPIYLLVGGAFGIFKQLLHICAKLHQRDEEEEIRQSATQMLINCFITGWFIIGSMWVYKEYEPNYDPSLGKYCNKTLYLFAFWLITLVYIMLAINIVWICGFSLVFVCLQKFC